jgi:hypothetical protein
LSGIILFRIRIGIGICVILFRIIRFRLKSQAAKVIRLSDCLVAIITRHDREDLRVLIADTQDCSAVLVNRNGLISNLSGDDGILDITSRLQSDVVTALLSNCIRVTSVIVNPVKGTGYTFLTKAYIALKLCDVLAVKSFVGITVSSNGQI